MLQSQAQQWKNLTTLWKEFIRGMWRSFIHVQDIEITSKPRNDVFRTAQLHGRCCDTLRPLQALLMATASQNEVLSEGHWSIF